MRARRKFKDVYRNVPQLKGAPVPGWRVLLAPGGLSRWVQWAGRFMAARHRHERPMDAADDNVIVPAYMIDSWVEFKARYGSF